MSAKACVLQGLYGDSDAIDFDEAWDILSSSLLEIHNKNASILSFEELYRHAYKLVLKKKGELLYQKVKNLEEACLSETVQPHIVSSLSTSLLLSDSYGTSPVSTVNEKRAEGEKLLRLLKKAWEDHNLCMNMITDVLMYMVRLPPWRVNLLILVLRSARSVFTAQISENPLSSPHQWVNFATLY